MAVIKGARFGGEATDGVLAIEVRPEAGLGGWAEGVFLADGLLVALVEIETLFPEKVFGGAIEDGELAIVGEVN